MRQRAFSLLLQRKSNCDGWMRILVKSGRSCAACHRRISEHGCFRYFQRNKWLYKLQIKKKSGAFVNQLSLHKLRKNLSQSSRQKNVNASKLFMGISPLRSGIYLFCCLYYLMQIFKKCNKEKKIQYNIAASINTFD